jgi:hypothetical protein
MAARHSKIKLPISEINLTDSCLSIPIRILNLKIQISNDLWELCYFKLAISHKIGHTNGHLASLLRLSLTLEKEDKTSLCYCLEGSKWPNGQIWRLNRKCPEIINIFIKTFFFY